MLCYFIFCSIILFVFLYYFSFLFFCFAVLYLGYYHLYHLWSTEIFEILCGVVYEDEEITRRPRKGARKSR